MMRSMFSGISGLKGFQQSMDVIGNNIANVNTVGYKASRTTFQSMLLQTVVGAKSPQEGARGGSNALQIGLGAQMASVDKIMNQGSFQNTGKKTDLGLQGEGFFILSDGIQNYYSRAGNFMIDEGGQFVQPSTGMKLQGWISKIDPKSGKRYLDLDRAPTDLFITAGMTMPAKATSNFSLGGNLNSDVGIEPLTITVKNPDDPTKNYKVRFNFQKLPPFDTKRIFSSGTIKYTWKAEIVDWNAESPSELPELNSTTGLVELNQFGQVEKFFVYSKTSLDGGDGTNNFDNTIINGDAQKTWFNYSPSGGTPIEASVKDIFDPNDDGIIDKVISKVVYNADSTTEYSLTPALTADGQVTTVTLNSIKPASNDTVNVSYYAQEDLVYVDGKTQYNLTGPILDSESTSEITDQDLLLSIVDTTGTVTYLTAGTDFTYDANSGTATIINTSAIPANPSKVRFEYATRDAFTGDGTKSNWQLTKKAISMPAGFATGKSTDGNDTKLTIDLNYTIDESKRRIGFRGPYPTTDPTKYDISYADPNNPKEFDTVDVVVGGTIKAQVSIPKTGNIKFFDKNDTQNYVTGDYVSPKFVSSTRIYDSIGNPYTIYLEFQKLKTNQWAWRATEETGIPISYVDDKEKEYNPSPSDLNSVVGGVVEFDSGGRVAAFKGLRQNGKVEDDISIVRIKFDPGNKVDDGAAPPPEEGASPISAGIDFSELVQFSSDFTASVTSQDGNSMGVLQAFAINTAGQVVGTFSNEKSDVLGQIAVASFNNPAGLVELGNTLYSVSGNSGLPLVGLPGTGGRGTVVPGVLEMSNVDLAEEFTGMVVVQRAFQANARTVTTVDQILQELVSLKR